MKNRSTSAQDARFTELLFENRNKNYGAYVLRTEEGTVLLKALLIGVAFFAAVSIAPVLFNVFEPKKDTVKPEPPVHVLRNVPQNPDVKPPVAAVQPPKAAVSSVKIDVPTPTNNPPVETPPATATQIRDTKIGLDNVTGETAPDIYIAPVQTAGTMVVPNTIPPKPVNNDPVAVVDVEASFPGGIGSFRSKVVQNFGTDHFEGRDEVMKTTVTFIVEKDGSITNVKANGSDSQFNAEAERTIKKVKGRWTPAKLNGESVRSYFKFPISMQFE